MEKDLWVEKFRIEALPEIIRSFRPERVIIFGSRARGTASEESDIDVIVIAEYFKDIPFIRRMPVLLNRVPFSKHVDYLCYTSDEFDRIRHTSSIIEDALLEPLELAVS